MIATQRETADARAEHGIAAAPAPRVAPGGAADWLSLAAAPTFAVMALLTSVPGGGMPDILCAAARDASPLSGMALMYLLMSAFHLAPWLRLVSGRPSARKRTCRLSAGTAQR
jgi:hypothetical protein